MDIFLDLLGVFWKTSSAMAPWLLFGFLMSGLLSILISPKYIETHLGGGGIWPVVKASAFGVPLPLCSCGVLPVAASLRRHGAGKGSTTAFLLSTPQTGVDSIMVTYSLMGPVFAVLRPLAALVTGLAGGVFVNFADKDAGEESRAECKEACCSDADGGNKLKRALVYAFITLPRDIAPALLIGLLIAGAISAFVPKDYFASWLGGGVGALFAMMALGIPVYVCATASVPVAAAMIVQAGVSPGAALAFLMTGPATNVAAITTLLRILGKRATSIYMLTVAAAALACGMFLDVAFPDAARSVIEHHTVHEGGPVGPIAAVVLFLVLGVAMLPRRRGTSSTSPEEPSAERFVLTIGGMTCGHCAEKVRSGLMEQDGVASVEVDLKAGKATVGGEGFDRDALVTAVEGLGYQAGMSSEGAVEDTD